MAIVHDKFLVKIGKAAQLWVEDMNRTRILIDSNKSRQKALSRCEDFSKVFPAISDYIHITLLQCIVIIVPFY